MKDTMDLQWEKLDDSWNDIHDVTIYGFGRVAQRNIKKISEDFDIKIIIDNDAGVRDNADTALKIYSLEQALPLLKKYKILVTTSSFAYESIRQDLIKNGLAEYKDFCRLETFMLEWYWKNKGQVCISQVLSAITTRCTFRCKHCSNLMPYFKHQYDYTEKDIQRDLLLLFSRVDYLASYYIIGGEPLLNPKLPEILAMVCNNFYQKIGYIQVITNGSIVPSDKLVEVLKRYDVKVRISNYTRAIPYFFKYNEVVQKCKEKGIDYSISDYQTWMSLGFPIEEVNIQGDKKEHMLYCSQGCHSVNDGKFYYCSTLWDAEKSGLYEIGENDCIDLTKSSDNVNNDKFEFLKYCLGISEGYIGLCEKCRGFGKDNNYIVDVAEQI